MKSKNRSAVAQETSMDISSSSTSRCPHVESGEPIVPMSKADTIRMLRITAEALETTLFLCNAHMDRYGGTEIVRILNAILSTAYVYNTGYWVFYKTSLNKTVCICNRFGIKCEHKFNNQLHHCLDVKKIGVEVPVWGSVRVKRRYFPTDVTIWVAPHFKDHFAGYAVRLILFSKLLVEQNSKFVVKNMEEAVLEVNFWFVLNSERVPLSEDIALVFDPHPKRVIAHSSYFENLDTFHDKSDIPATYTLTPIDLPKYTVLPAPMEGSSRYDDMTKFPFDDTFKFSACVAPIERVAQKTQMFVNILQCNNNTFLHILRLGNSNSNRNKNGMPVGHKVGEENGKCKTTPTDKKMCTRPK